MRMLKVTTKSVSLMATGIVFAGSFGPNSASASRAPAPVDGQQSIDLVIALDVSGSMSGLIDSTKQRLWDIVNELAEANPQPDLRMAILTYGNPAYGEQSGYVKINMPFSRDLDAINQTLFSFTTNGGDEYVGRAIQHSVSNLKWSADPDALKILFVAGNEAADQDPLISTDFAVQLASSNGIVVNTIYCGDPGDNLVAGWQAYATQTNGMFASINQSAAAVANVATPMDTELVELNKTLNETYIPYGQVGGSYKANQVEQDKNSEAMSAPSLASRTLTKIGKLYDNAKWDLVDAVQSGIPVEDFEAENLPEPMREMNTQERKDYVADLAGKRAEVSEKIAALGEERQVYIDAERARASSDDDIGLDEAMIDGIRKIAETRGFDFDEE